jgi:hypothetical protein
VEDMALEKVEELNPGEVLDMVSSHCHWLEFKMEKKGITSRTKAFYVKKSN